MALGSLFLVAADDLLVAWPMLVIAAAVAVTEWRHRRRTSAAMVVAGTALPSTILWGVWLILLVGGVAFDPGATIRGFAIGALPLAAALIIAGRSGPTAGEAPAPRPRSFGMIAAALREPNRIGPFGTPEVAAVVAIVATNLAAVFVPVGDWVVRFIVVAILGSAVASEAYLRAMQPRSRRAFEALAWVGEPDVAAFKKVTGGRVPTTRRAAEAWLARHPLAADESAAMRGSRIHVLLLAGRLDEARAAIASRPAPVDAVERFDQAADAEFLAWYASDPDVDARLAAMVPLAAAIEPADGDARLRAEVGLAMARTRALATAPPEAAGGAGARPDSLGPLVEVRDRLGARADGLVRRVVWRRTFVMFLFASALFAVLGLATGVLQAP
jgi:hypothetical protein